MLHWLDHLQRDCAVWEMRVIVVWRPLNLSSMCVLYVLGVHIKMELCGQRCVKHGRTN